MESTQLPRKNATEWLSQGKYFEFEKQQIFYIRDGRGTNLFLLHGYPTCSWDYSKIFSGLIRYYNVSVLDMLGFGYTAKPKKFPYSIHKQADLVEAYLDKQAIKRVRFVFHDYSVSIGQELLARYKERGEKSPYKIDGVLFLNGGLFPQLHRPTRMQKLLSIPFLGGILIRFLTEEKFGKALSEVFGSKTKPSERDIGSWFKLVQYPGKVKISHKLLHYIKDRKVHQERWKDALDSKDVSLHFLLGEDDPVSGQHVSEYLRSNQKEHWTLQTLPVGHYPQWESPEAVYQAIRERFPT